MQWGDVILNNKSYKFLKSRQHNLYFLVHVYVYTNLYDSCFVIYLCFEIDVCSSLNEQGSNICVAIVSSYMQRSKATLEKEIIQVNFIKVFTKYTFKIKSFNYIYFFERNRQGVFH